MKNYLIFTLLFVSISSFANPIVINSKHHNPDNKKYILKKIILVEKNSRIINSKYHNPDNKKYHVIKNKPKNKD
ncbi:hypothetical protein [Photobacterium phosphoreum]|uniref:hypothetical protein n=1 Tax=Photobacterium phosphoreum TaxID=659 RepID=UPI000D151427|nr:hypothetical protein [Photobacterium phosphoreum]PSU74513.1 hypothetical protein CTM67_19140 [Photobacterium phosphoreum]